MNEALYISRNQSVYGSPTTEFALIEIQFVLKALKRAVFLD